MSIYQNNIKLETRNITKSFGDKTVIKDINIKIYDGEIVSLLGVSGSGKTTLFNIISGLIKPDSGSVILNNEDITGKAGKVSYMLQKDLLLPYKSIIDNVSLPLIIKGENKKNARDKVRKHFKEFGLEGNEENYPHELSGGMRQRAALFRTYMFSNDIALLDEPFSQLDTFTRVKMHEWYLSIMETIKLTTIFITHDIDEAILLSDRIYILSDRGVITYEITIDAKKPRHNDFTTTDEFIKYKREILKVLST